MKSQKILGKKYPKKQQKKRTYPKDYNLSESEVEEENKKKEIPKSKKYPKKKGKKH